MAGTFRELKGSEKTPGQEERSIRGMSSRHAYTIFGMEKIGDREYVKLRNPWGIGVSETVKNVHTGNITYRSNETRYGTFYMDIPTLAKHLERLQVLKGELPA